MYKRILLLPYLKKLIHDQRRVILFLVIGVASFEFLYVWIIQVTGMLQLAETYLKLVPPAFRNFLNVQPGTIQFSSQILVFGFSHPFILLMLSFLPASMASRYLAGEIENHTFDLFLTKPLRRYLVPLNVFLFLTVAIFLEVCAMFGGMWLAYIYLDIKIELSKYFYITLTAYVFYLSMSSATILLSTFFSERGKALTLIIGILITFYFFDSIIKLNDSMSYLKNFSYFQLYQPTDLVTGLKNFSISILISICITFVCLLFALVNFNHRDI